MKPMQPPLIRHDGYKFLTPWKQEAASIYRVPVATNARWYLDGTEHRGIAIHNYTCEYQISRPLLVGTRGYGVR